MTAHIVVAILKTTMPIKTLPDFGLMTQACVPDSSSVHCSNTTGLAFVWALIGRVVNNLHNIMVMKEGKELRNSENTQLLTKRQQRARLVIFAVNYDASASIPSKIYENLNT